MEGEKIATFKERFTELVESSPKSRTVIASEIGVAKQTISAWTTGQSSPRMPVITALADYFGVSLDWLCGFDVPKYVNKDIYVLNEQPPDDVPKNEKVRLLMNGVNKLSDDQIEQLTAMMRVMFAKTNPDLFEKGPESDDHT